MLCSSIITKKANQKCLQFIHKAYKHLWMLMVKNFSVFLCSCSFGFFLAENFFASASVDGSISIYNKSVLNSVKMVTKPISSASKTRIDPNSRRKLSRRIRGLLVISGKYLVVTLDDG